MPPAEVVGGSCGRKLRLRRDTDRIDHDTNPQRPRRCLRMPVVGAILAICRSARGYPGWLRRPMVRLRYDHTAPGTESAPSRIKRAREVSAVLRKLQWLRGWLTTQATQLERMTVLTPNDVRYVWIASAGVHIPRNSRQARQLSQSSIRKPRRQLLLP